MQQVLKNATEMHELVRDLELKQNLHNKIEVVSREGNMILT